MVAPRRPGQDLWRRIILAAVGAATATTVVYACGQILAEIRTVQLSTPIDVQRFDRGELGVVKPTFSRRYLIQAYRTISGAPQVPLVTSLPTVSAADAWEAAGRWETRRQAAGVEPSPSRTTTSGVTKRLRNFTAFDNCLAPAFDTAIETLNARVRRYGALSRQVREWLAAQDAVFANCDAEEPVLPASPTADADALERADRAYQTASAYFYAMQYEEAARRFRALADDASSPWRSHGRYLAGRAWLRHATVPNAEPDAEPDAVAAPRFAAAQVELQAALADPTAARFHSSARGLLDVIAGCVDPAARLREISKRLAADPAVAPQDVVDFGRLLDRIEIRASDDDRSREQLASLTASDDLLGWVSSLGAGDTVALERWLAAPSDTWLVAALWSTPPDHAEVVRLLDAAARVAPTAPAYPTIAFLRVRMLMLRGDVEGARQVLADLPTAPTRSFDADAVNLLDAARLAVASNLEEMLAVAPRRLVAVAREDGADFDLTAFTRPIWDADVASVFNVRLTLDQLVVAAESDRLPARLRRRVAQAAFTRAVVLARADTGRRAAHVLRRLAVPLRGDLDRYLAATTDDERLRAGALTLLRTPGLSILVRGEDTDYSYSRAEPTRRLGHAFASNWWCPRLGVPIASASARMLGVESPIAFPAFVAERERDEVTRELDALRAIGEPRVFLISAALAWARTRPTDPDAAEALARAIEGWRWSPCEYGQKSPLPGRAFAVLHRQFPNSPWAERTRYWYN